jgi:peptidoglycan/LPS O-acetylase OafA/YrhL
MNVLPHLLLTAILPYFIFFFAFSKNIKLTKFGKFGDFSYGMYLYAFPIQQTIVSIIPDTTNIWINIFLFFLFLIPIAFLSWRYIEEPALEVRFKKK